jgi:hypothetical protein
MSTQIQITPKTGITVGTTSVTSGTDGRVFFQAGGVVQQDGAFFWDNTNKRLGVGATPASTVRLDVRAQGALSTDIAFRVRNSADTINTFEHRGNGVTKLCGIGTVGGYAIPNDAFINAFILTTENIGANPPALTKAHLLLAENYITIRASVGGTTPRQVLQFNAEDYGGTARDWSLVATAINDGALYFNGGAGTANRRMFLTDSATLNIGKDTMLNVNSGTNQLRILNGTAPTTLAADTFALYSADITAGNAAPHFRTENGNVIKLYQEAAVTTAQGIATALATQGLLATSTIVPTVQSVVTAATVTPVAGNEEVVITAQAADFTIANPTGTWYQGQDLIIRIKDDGTGRAITWDSDYRAIGVTLPTTTVANKLTYVGIIYNSTDSKWDILGVSQEA